MKGGRDLLDSLDDEIRDHIEREAEENIARGMSRDDVYTAARRAFGNATLTKEAARTVWIPMWWDQLLQDARYGLRLCVRAPGFALVVALTLALGIGLNTAVFSVVYGIVLRPLPFAHSDRIVRISENIPPPDGSSTPRRVGALRGSEVATLRSKSGTLSHVGVSIPTIRTVTSRDEPVRMIGVRLSPDLLTMLDTPPLLGRVFTVQEDTPGVDAVVILSFAAWQRSFAGDRDLVGGVSRSMGLRT